MNDGFKRINAILQQWPGPAPRVQQSRLTPFFNLMADALASAVAAVWKKAQRLHVKPE